MSILRVHLFLWILEVMENIGEKRGGERNLLGCLVGWIGGWKTGGAWPFSPRSTKIFSPKIKGKS